ncbi:MAG: MMPL family transporter [Atribacterota bacterium]|nr:MMPL family transporter [Atribacterota bacterium]
MKQLARFITKYSKIIIIFIIFITILGLTQINNLRIEDDITKYLAETDPEIIFYQEITDKFGQYDKNLTLISLEYHKTIFTLDNLQNFKTITENLQQSEYIISVDSFLNMPKIIGTDYGIEVKEFVELFPETEEDVLQLKADALRDDLIKENYLSADGRVALIMIESPDNVNGSYLRDDLENILNEHKENIVRIEYFGLPIMEVQITEMALNNMSLAITAAIVIIAILYYCFRSLQGTFLPILIALLTSFWILSLVASSGKTVTIIISVIPVLMLALVTAYGIHFINRYYEERNKLSAQDAIENTIEFISIPIFMSALTTMAGFSSLITAVVRPMTEFGIFTTIGIFLSFLLIIFLLGAIFSIFAPKKIPKNFSSHADDMVSKILKKITLLVLNKKGTIVTLTLIILVFSIISSSLVKTDSTIESRLGTNNPITKSMEYFKDKFGGVDFLYVYLETTDNAKHPYVLRSIDKIQNFAKRLPSLSQPSSVAIFIRQLNNAMENREIIPSNPDKIDNLWFFAENNEYINSMLANNNKDTILQIRSKEMVSTDTEQSIQELENFIQQIPKKIQVVDISQLSLTEKQYYYPYITQEIIDSWQANGLELNKSQLEELKIELNSIAALAENFFIQKDESFIKEIITLSSLELEDFGITATEIEPAISNYLQSALDDSLFIEKIIEQMDISEYDAEYLKDIVNTSITIATQRKKVEYAKDQMLSKFNLNLNQENSNYLWYLLDDYACIPDQDGDISFSFRLTGIPVITSEVNKSIYDGQVKSMFAAFLIVFILLIIQFQSLLIGIISIIPILLTIVTAFGIMGITRISLNIGTMMVASIAIGAGIDYTIHFITRYKQEFIKKPDPVEVTTITLTGSGRAIFFNSLSVAAGCFVLAFSEIKMISEFAILIGSVMLISVIYTLLLLPILLFFLKFKKLKR